MIRSIELDAVSRATVGRFVWKAYLSLAITLFSRSTYLESASHCLLLYAVLMAMVAAFMRERYDANHFNHWSEALWLSFIAAGLHLLQ